ncbi:hypothetical protein N9K75_02970 [bacterium]|jgi:hypothetical protein|nr:hypothetical protein [bacterium]|tara:strand:+ start:769 stop:1383 length:615 start_codon:yes stop_codon:yes gene_type:complete
MSKCPPGVICFENFTFIYVIIAIVVMLYLFYIRQSSINNDKQSPAMNTTSNNNYSQNGIFPRPSYSFSNVQNDVLMNPYTPPLKDERVFMSNDVRGGVPININTRAVDTSYRQIGLLKRMNGEETLLPLLGRPLYVGRDKWQYYTMNDSNNQLKLPVSFKSKSCTSEYGCDEISNGDTVYVDGINATFQATIYDNATMRYIPFA